MKRTLTSFGFDINRKFLEILISALIGWPLQNKLRVPDDPPCTHRTHTSAVRDLLHPAPDVDVAPADAQLLLSLPECGLHCVGVPGVRPAAGEAHLVTESEARDS